MPNMGKYCKAYPVERFRGFSGWTEKLENLRKDRTQENGEGQPAAAAELKDDDYLYLQENFVVTDGIFLDQNVIFDQVSPEWIEFCEHTLEFKVPDFETSKAENATTDAQENNA